MKFQYIGDGKQDPHVANIRGIEFILNGPVIFVEDQDLVRKLKGNRTFKCVDIFDAEVVEPDVEIIKAEVDLPEEPDDEPTTLEDLRAQCELLDIKYHHKAGVKKLTELIEQAV